MFAYDPLGICGEQLLQSIKQVPYIEELEEVKRRIIKEEEGNTDMVVEEQPTDVNLTLKVSEKVKERCVDCTCQNLSQVKQGLLEREVFERLLSEITECFNVLSSSESRSLARSISEFIEESYKQSTHRTAATLTGIQRLLSAVVKRFEEFIADVGSSGVSNVEFAVGRNLRLISNIFEFRKILPLSNITSLAFERLMNENLTIITNITSTAAAGRKAFLLAKVRREGERLVRSNNVNISFL